MIYKCTCGRTKTAQPWKSCIVKAWLCDNCAGEGRHNPPPKVQVIKVNTFVAKFRTKQKSYNVG